jgi:hypothetical protein
MGKWTGEVPLISKLSFEERKISRNWTERNEDNTSKELST